MTGVVVFVLLLLSFVLWMETTSAQYCKRRRTAGRPKFYAVQRLPA